MFVNAKSTVKEVQVERFQVKAGHVRQIHNESVDTCKDYVVPSCVFPVDNQN